MPKAKMTAGDKRRKKIREREFGDDSWDRVWKGASGEKGYWIAPRTLPILLRLASEKAVTGKLNCGSVYLELFSQNWGQGIIEIRDEEAHGFRAGFCPSRALRSWRERIDALEKAGFIEVRPRSNRRIGYILIVHPNRVLAHLRETQHMSDDLWRAYQEICGDFGIEAIDDPLATGPRGIVPQSAGLAATAPGVAWSLGPEPEDDDIPF